VARELKYHEALYDFLARHLEAARIDEAKNAVVVQVVDSAVEPERKSSPKRLLIVAITARPGICASLFSYPCPRGNPRKSGIPSKPSALPH
jgi:uncharacterized protein involved in exopolysaccharide biosynthesis